MSKLHYASFTLLVSLLACKSGQPARVANSTLASESDSEAGQKYPGPPKSDKFNQNYIWQDYCSGNVNNPSAQIIPNYDNNLVRNAAGKLSQMWDHSYYMYDEYLRKYPETKIDPPGGVTQNAHTFLVYLCGEFRDRPSMIAAKLGWLASTNVLGREKVETFDVTRDPFEQMTAHDYLPFTRMSAALYQARISNEKIQIGQYRVDTPVPAMTVCDVKYMFSEYIRKGRSFDSISSYNSNFEQFKSNCSQEDLDYLVDFRGDSNIKPNSPESNAMIWFGMSTVMQCLDREKAAPDGNKYVVERVQCDGSVKTRTYTQNIKIGDEQCAEYYSKPFETRWNAARSALGSWMLRHESLDYNANNTKKIMKIIPNFGDDYSSSPMNFFVESEKGHLMENWKQYWHSSSFGIENQYNTGDFQVMLYERLKAAVDRHTDWYASGYDDEIGHGKTRSQAFSPFVASSYEISLSDGFVNCGPTIPCICNDTSWKDSRNYKHFMYVFKVYKDRWYTPHNLQNKQIPNFDLDWFDETTFGTVPLAKQERAWDRLGTPLENELYTVLYLHNICSNGRVAEQVDSKGRGICGPGFNQ